MRDPAVAPFRVQLERATALPKVPEWERIVTEMQTVAERMVRGQFSVDEAAREIDARADRLLEKRRWMLEKGRTLCTRSAGPAKRVRAGRWRRRRSRRSCFSSSCPRPPRCF